MGLQRNNNNCRNDCIILNTKDFSSIFFKDGASKVKIVAEEDAGVSETGMCILYIG
jgi:hypothetical protein